MKVDLNAFDLNFIAMYAERMSWVKYLAGTHSKKYDTTKTEFGLHYIGAMGEFGVKKVTGCPLSMQIMAGGDPRPDTIIKGKTAQIKTNNFQGKTLEFFVDDMKSFNAEILVGVQVLSPVLLEIHGYIDKTTFERVCVKKNYGYGERLMVPSGLLTPLEQL
jgi:hypothetical protein